MKRMHSSNSLTIESKIALAMTLLVCAWAFCFATLSFAWANDAAASAQQGEVSDSSQASLANDDETAQQIENLDALEEDGDIQELSANWGNLSSIPKLRITLSGTTLEWINSHGKDVKYEGNAIEITDAEGNVVTYEDLTIKGRGNSTWSADKKPYQIGFSSKVNLFGLGKAKKWVLLATAYDPSLLRNDVSFKVASDMGIEGTATGQFVDLFVDDDYLGCYYLVHKVENSSASINLKSDAGILVEIDNSYYHTETTYETASNNDHIVLKDQSGEEDDPQTAASLTRFTETYNKLLEAAEQSDWSTITSLIDVDSFAELYLMEELSADPDMYCSSSYFYQDGDDDVLHAAPAWDFDLGYGNGKWGQELSGVRDTGRSWAFTTPNRELGAHGSSNLIALLNDIPEFRAVAKQLYNEEMKPSLESLPEYITSRASQIRTSATSDASLWGAADFDSSVNSLMSWIAKRKVYLDFLFSDSAEMAEGEVTITSSTGLSLTGDGKYYNVYVKDVQGSAFSIKRLDNGFYTIGTDAETVLGPSGLSHKNNVGVSSSTYTADTAQQWFFIPAGDSGYRIVNKVSGGVITAVGEGVAVHAYDPDDDNQVFYIEYGAREITRLWGQTALDTMSEIVNAGSFAEGGVAVVATINGYWDALTASTLAGAYNAPVLLTDSDELSAQTAAQLKSLAPSKVYIVGGTAAVSASVESAIGAIAGSVTRLAGNDAIGTAIAVGNEVARSEVSSSTCIIATVNGFYDALSAASIAYAKGYPIYLASGNGTLTEETLASIEQAGLSNAVIVGGTAAVSESVEDQLSGIGVSSVRKAGENAWQTSATVAEWGLELGMSADNMGVADGNGYWDALTGAALCGKSGSVMVLVPHDDITAEGVQFEYDSYCIDNFIAKHAASINDLRVFGGSSAVPATTIAAIRAALS